MPYGAEQLAQFPLLVRSLESQDIEWVIHVGDIKAASTPCTEDLLKTRISDIDAIRHPVIYIPGDNEWTDCWYQTESSPLQWLSVLRSIAYPTYGESLGESGMTVAYQSAGSESTEYPEHQSWVRYNVHFTTLHFVGSDNGLADFPGRTDEHGTEVSQRIDAAVSWLNQSFDKAESTQATAMVISTHANPFPESTEPNPAYDIQPFADFQETLARRAIEFGKPILLLHGDTHTFRFDRPLTLPETGERVENVFRLEVFGAPTVGWVEVNVNTNSADVFSISPRVLPD